MKAQLAAEQLRNLGWVEVDTSAGTVYLSGTASAEAQKLAPKVGIRPDATTTPRASHGVSA